ncbi:hypothetical protein FOQG_00067 [Fusarium oxysporum f. sp. raphani 54005]|uniref:Uncharacterized protein n=8 Tax=Fusarium oxysporum TaxID=5507 RepID=W9J287_FUSOX|nr:hypothetical protein FOXG_21913 [Fusarium oxysporum f. sp. lycopersici 4287]EWY99715.1 hypothetical protein FOYG_03677 [Fusarium oxysporum NRRL 32931]EWZ45740.1 hypothetical protein FOZG_05968 [Fusarium oxysporum Fo47]EWZ97443.1 hypothetical protein FOWG_01914 [Fusarium oxysporum f. sp. lycopersici MN25]EXA51015.1 hypothetical protein FOVG_03503 [Fusarium oxysporum f. sp. pisi HDV247]EXK43161.1 hypothetical protein FOMG_05820 [Fusarium oxysporum f. sp. melonis 26406]EXK99599.1 hypothetical
MGRKESSVSELLLQPKSQKRICKDGYMPHLHIVIAIILEGR